MTDCARLELGHLDDLRRNLSKDPLVDPFYRNTFPLLNFVRGVFKWSVKYLGENIHSYKLLELSHNLDSVDPLVKLSQINGGNLLSLDRIGWV